MQAQHIDFLQLLNGEVQYVIPLWQRRYCWGKSDIKGLVDDLITIAKAKSDATHYGGTLLTFDVSQPAGAIKITRVVDGQQRLTTVSILLACIADKLERDGSSGHWTPEYIREHRLRNPSRKSTDESLKLQLQPGDYEEYRSGLEGIPKGPGAVAAAWSIMKRLVEESDIDLLLKGLQRLKVVTIGLGPTDDPQQIFQSLNATGRPLTESEKVKNWLLIGLPEEEQRKLYDKYWRGIEQALDANHSTERIDTFLMDLMRWRTGEVHGVRKTYEHFRRWAISQRLDEKRADICRDLERLARLYGILTGKAEEYPNSKVSREIRHLRALGIDVHRPLTLRLLHEATADESIPVTDHDLAKTLKGIGAWVTRVWLSGRPTGGLNNAIAELAGKTKIKKGGDYAEQWFDQIRGLRNRNIGVPSDMEIEEGIQTRNAYGGAATRPTFAVLCELMEAEHRREAPSRGPLTIEHIIPQKLTDQWRRYLGKNAEEIHVKFRHRLANLTLCGPEANSEMSANPFASKRKIYKKSTIGMTRRLAEEERWNETALTRRADELAHLALKRWPWHDPGSTPEARQNVQAEFRWQIEDGNWHYEVTASQMVLNVTGALLDLNPEFTNRLTGDSKSTNIHPASRYPAESKAGALVMKAVPGHKAWVLNPYQGDYSASVKYCEQLGEKCGKRVQVELIGMTGRFWRFLEKETGRLPGQTEKWLGPTQWTAAGNAFGDYIGLSMGKMDEGRDYVRAYIRAGGTKTTSEAVVRMQRFSNLILEQMGDQDTSGNVESESHKGRSVAVLLQWNRDNEDEWLEAAVWIKRQFGRLRFIIAD